MNCVFNYSANACVSVAEGIEKIVPPHKNIS